jgi:hypothetical protein
MKVVYNKSKAQRVNELSELKSSLEEIDLLIDNHSDYRTIQGIKLLVMDSNKSFGNIPIFRTIRDIIGKLSI